MSNYFIRIDLTSAEALEDYLLERKISFRDIQISLGPDNVAKIYSITIKDEDATALRLALPILGILKVDI